MNTDNISDKTNSVGKATFRLDKGNYKIDLTTLFSETKTQAVFVDGDIFSGSILVEFNEQLPSNINNDYFKNILFFNGNQNYRWEKLDLDVSFNYSKTSADITEAKNNADIVVWYLDEENG